MPPRAGHDPCSNSEFISKNYDIKDKGLEIKLKIGNIQLSSFI